MITIYTVTYLLAKAIPFLNTNISSLHLELSRLSIFTIFFILVLILNFIITYLHLRERFYLINKIYLKLKQNSYLNNYYIFFIFIFSFLTIFGYFDFTLVKVIDPIINSPYTTPDGGKIYNVLGDCKFIGDGDGTTSSTETPTPPKDPLNNFNTTLNTTVNGASVTGHVNEGSVSINTPQMHLKIPTEGVNNLAAAASASGGAAIALRAAQHFPGTPTTKLAVGLGAMATVQLSTAAMSKLFNSSTTKGGNNFISNIFSNTSVDPSGLNDKFPDFPLNLLPEVNGFINVQLLFLIIIFNMYLVKLLIKIDYTKHLTFLSNSKIGSFILKIINRYVTIWSQSSNYILGLCWAILFYCTIFLKFCMYNIINN